MITEWHPIEAAPLDRTPLLLFVPGISDRHRYDGMPDIVVGLWVPGGVNWPGNWVCDIGEITDEYESGGSYFEHVPIHPTHWMPLPALPETNSP